MPETRRNPLEVYRDHCRDMADRATTEDERGTWTTNADDIDKWLIEGFGDEQEESLW